MFHKHGLSGQKSFLYAGLVWGIKNRKKNTLDLRPLEVSLKIFWWFEWNTSLYSMPWITCMAFMTIVCFLFAFACVRDLVVRRFAACSQRWNWHWLSGKKRWQLWSSYAGSPVNRVTLTLLAWSRTDSWPRSSQRSSYSVISWPTPGEWAAPPTDRPDSGNTWSTSSKRSLPSALEPSAPLLPLAEGCINNQPRYRVLLNLSSPCLIL